MYELRERTDNQNYLTKNAVANMVKKEHNIKLSPKEIKEIIDELVRKGLIEKTSNGIRISTQGIQSFEVKTSRSKVSKIVVLVILGITVLGSALYYVYS